MYCRRFAWVSSRCYYCAGVPLVQPMKFSFWMKTSSSFYLSRGGCPQGTSYRTALSCSCCSRGAQEELTPGLVHDCRAVSFSELRKESWNPVLSCCLPFFLPTSGSLCFSRIKWATEYKRLEVGWKGQKCFFLYWVNSYLGLVSLITWLVTVLRCLPTFRSTLWELPPSGCYYWYFQEHLWKVWQEGTALSSYPEIRRVRIFKKHFIVARSKLDPAGDSTNCV